VQTVFSTVPEEAKGIVQRPNPNLGLLVGVWSLHSVDGVAKQAPVLDGTGE
jgi:hypothetical protein